MSTTKSYTEMRDDVLAKAARDGDFRARLLSDPKGAVADQLGVELPETLDIAVHEESATTAHLVLPPAAALNEGELTAIAAGSPATGYTGHVHPDTGEEHNSTKIW